MAPDSTQGEVAVVFLSGHFDFQIAGRGSADADIGRRPCSTPMMHSFDPVAIAAAGPTKSKSTMPCGMASPKCGNNRPAGPWTRYSGYDTRPSDLQGVPLAPGVSYTVTANFTTTTATAAGNCTFFVKADGHSSSGGGGTNTDGGNFNEASENNNTASAAVTLAPPPKPDLKISGLTLNGVTMQSDGSWAIGATYTVTNVGSVAATGGWNDMGYLSANGVLDSNSQDNNYYLYAARADLAPGASYTATVGFPSTKTTAPGAYSFFMKTDGHSPGYNGAGTSNTDGGSLVESDETNNAMSVPVTFTHPDLKRTSMSVMGAIVR